MRKSFTKVLLMALVVVVMFSMTIIGASAADPIVYDGSEDAATFLASALDEAENGEVTIDLQADMVFDADADYAVTEIKAASGNIPTNTITVTSTTGNGIVMGEHFPNVVLYGNFLFKDITYGANAEKVNANGLIFPDGCSGTFGYVDGESWGGITAGAKKANIAGNVTVYSGTYKVIAGNLYNSKTTIDAPKVIARGNTRATQGIYGGSYNGGSGVVTGVGELKVLDKAWATDIGGGGYFGNSAASGGVIAEVNTTSTETIERIAAGQTGTFAKAATFTMTIYNAKVKYICGTRATSGAHSCDAGVVVNLIIENAQVSENVYGSLYPTSGGKDKTVKGTYNTTIKGGTFSKGIYGGAYINAVETTAFVHDATTYLKIEGGTFNAGVYGGCAVTSSVGKDDVSLPAQIKGTNTLEITGGDINSTVYAGPYLTKKAVFTNTVNLIISGGDFASTVFGGSNVAITADEDIVYGATTDVKISGGTFGASGNTVAGSFFGGSYISENSTEDNIPERTLNHTGSTTIEFTGGTFPSKVAQGGSYLLNANAADDPSIHSGTITVTIKAGTFNSGFYGGSNIPANKRNKHKGEIFVTLQGVQGKVTTFGNHLSAGSCLSAGAEQTGDSHLYIYDTYTSATAFNGYAQTFIPGTNRKIFAGPQMDNGTMSGNSELIVRRSDIQNTIELYGGSRMDKKNSVMTGNSVLRIDANTGLVDGVETEGQNGFTNINALLIGGSLINGYISSSDKTSESTQSGSSKVELVGPADRVAGDALHQLRLNNYRVFGGHYFSGNVCKQQQNDSAVYIIGDVDAMKTDARVAGGSLYSNRLYEQYGTEVASSKVVIDGNFKGAMIIAGSQTVYNGSGSQTFYSDIGIVYKSGSVEKSRNLCGYQTSNTTGTIRTSGNVLLEIWGTAATDGMVFDVGISTNFSNIGGTRCLKLVGVFNAVAGQGETDGFDIYTNVNYPIFDYSQASGSSLNFDKYTDKDTNGDGVKERTYTQGHTSVYERLSNTKFVKIVSSDSAVVKNVETEKNEFQGTIRTFAAGDNFAAILAESGIKFYTDYDDRANNRVDIPKVYTYADYTLYDAVSEAPNAFRFFTVTDDGKADKEVEVVGAAMDKYIVKSGIITCYPVDITNATLTATENDVKTNYEATGFSIRPGKLGFRYRAKINKDFLEANIAKVAGNEDFMIKELGIKVSATINENAWTTKAVAWENGNVGTAVQNGWLIDAKDPGYYYFAAVITGFNNDITRIQTNFTFEVYATYEDINGDVYTVAIGVPQTNSLYTVADMISQSTDPEVVAWYTENKAEVDAILNLAKA